MFYSTESSILSLPSSDFFILFSLPFVSPSLGSALLCLFAHSFFHRSHSLLSHLRFVILSCPPSSLCAHLVNGTPRHDFSFSFLSFLSPLSNTPPLATKRTVLGTQFIPVIDHPTVLSLCSFLMLILISCRLFLFLYSPSPSARFYLSLWASINDCVHLCFCTLFMHQPDDDCDCAVLSPRFILFPSCSR